MRRPVQIAIAAFTALAATAAAAQTYGPYRWRRAFGPAEWRVETTVTVGDQEVRWRVCEGMARPKHDPDPALACVEDRVEGPERRAQMIRWSERFEAYALDLLDQRLTYRDGDAPALAVSPGARPWSKTPKLRR